MKRTARIRLVEERKHRGWSQRELADYLGTTQHNVSRWEAGVTTPGPYFRTKLEEVFEMSAQQLGLLDEKSPGRVPASAYWHVPFHRNPFFTGREALLQSLSTHLHHHRTKQEVSLVALSGLGGVGKTQLALEYAYRSRRNYHAILWVQADSSSLLLANFAHLTHALHLSTGTQEDQQQAIQTVQYWLQEHGPWLLIYDNVEEKDVVRSLLPTLGQGQVLITTRHHAIEPLATQIEVDALPPEEGALLLLHRARMIAPTVPPSAIALPRLEAAKTLSHLLGNLPLALDQAAAYIEETSCDLVGYLARYQQHQLPLLQRRGSSPDHPASVAATWAISFERLQQLNPTAATLLQWCALLHPDAIPEELFIAVPQSVSFPPLALDVLHLDRLIDVLRTFSLVRRHPETGTLSLHRLVQAVLLATMDEPTQQRLAERLVHTMNALFPDCQPATWQRCHRYVPQALVCAQRIQQWRLVLPEAARLLSQTGRYLQARASYDQAAHLYQQALDLYQRLGSANEPEGIGCLFALATLYEAQGRIQEAETLYQDVLARQTHAFGPEHPEIAQTLNALALFYYKQDKYAQAEPLFQQALRIFQHSAEPSDPDLAQCLSNLGTLYRELGHYRQAERLQQQAWRLREHIFGPDHLEVAASYRSLAILAHEQGDFQQARMLYQQALCIRETTLGPDHPEVALILRGLGLLSYGLRNYPEAQAYYQRVFDIRQHVLRPGHPALGDVFTLQGELFVAQERWSEANVSFHSALAIWEPLLDPDNPDLAHCFNGLAEVAVAQGAYDEAEALCQRALTILRGTFGEDHQYVAQSLHVLAGLRCAQAHYEHAEALYQQALSILEHHFGDRHPRIAQSLHGLAIVYEQQAWYRQALPLYERTLTIYAQFLHPEHPDVVFVQQQSVRLQRYAAQQVATE